MLMEKILRHTILDYSSLRDSPIPNSTPRPTVLRQVHFTQSPVQQPTLPRSSFVELDAFGGRYIVYVQFLERLVKLILDGVRLQHRGTVLQMRAISVT